MKRNSAFTLIEILLVVIIIGIVSALSVPNFSKGFLRFQLKRTAEDLLNVSRWAQAMAIGQQCIYALDFSDDHRSYGIVKAVDNEEMDGHAGFEPVKGPLGRVHQLPDSVGLVMTQPYGFKDLHAEDSQEAATGDNERIEFYPDGMIDPVTIQLDSSGQKIEISSSEVRGMMTRVDHE